MNTHGWFLSIRFYDAYMMKYYRRPYLDTCVISQQRDISIWTYTLPCCGHWCNKAYLLKLHRFQNCFKVTLQQNLTKSQLSTLLGMECAKNFYRTISIFLLAKLIYILHLEETFLLITYSNSLFDCYAPRFERYI